MYVFLDRHFTKGVCICSMRSFSQILTKGMCFCTMRSIRQKLMKGMCSCTMWSLRQILTKGMCSCTMRSLSKPCCVMVNNRLSCLGCHEKEDTIWGLRTTKKNKMEHHLQWLVYLIKKKNVYCKSVYLRVGENYTSYAVSLKSQKISTHI